MRERVANWLLGVATWVLPDGHPAIRAIYDAAWTIDDPDWIEKRFSELLARYNAAHDELVRATNDLAACRRVSGTRHE